MPSWQWEKPSFSWQRPPPAYSFRLRLSNMPRFPNWSHPKISLCALGLLPTANLRGPMMAMAPQVPHCPGEGLCAHQQPQHWWSLQGIHKLMWPGSPTVCKESKEGIDSVPLLPWPCSRDIQGRGQRGAHSMSWAASSQQAELQQARGRGLSVHPKDHLAGPTQPLCSMPA